MYEESSYGFLAAIAALIALGLALLAGLTGITMVAHDVGWGWLALLAACGCLAGAAGIVRDLIS